MGVAETREKAAGSTWTERIARVEAVVELMSSARVAHLASSDRRIDGRHLELASGRVVHFGNCSYLGLELDERLKRGACQAIERFGVVFSSSRAYVSVPLFEELEELVVRHAGVRLMLNCITRSKTCAISSTSSRTVSTATACSCHPRARKAPLTLTTPSYGDARRAAA